MPCFDTLMRLDNARGSQSTVFLHIGMPKAASSYLHGTVFPRLMSGRYIMPGARNAKKPEYQFRRNAFTVRRFSDSFHRRSDFWRRHGDEFLKYFLSPVLHGGHKPGSVLISDEAVTRVNHFNIRQMPGAFNRHEIENNFRLFAQAAQCVGFNRAKVLLIIRRQDFLLAASYAQLSRKIMGASQADFEKRIDRLIKNNSNAAKNDFYSLDYYRLCQCLGRSLTKKNLMVIALEEFSHDFPRVIRKLINFFGVRESERLFSQASSNSRSLGDNQWKLRPLLLCKSGRGKIAITAPRQITGRARKIALKPSISRAIMHNYADSNRKLARMLDIELDKFGYCSY